MASERRIYLRDAEEFRFHVMAGRDYTVVFKLGERELVGRVSAVTKLAHIYDHICREWNGGERPAHSTIQPLWLFYFPKKRTATVEEE